MNVSELTAGNTYLCRLSGANVLIFESEEQKVTGSDGVEITLPSKKVGKVCIKKTDGDFKYAFVDLHDGQMIKQVK